MYHSYISRWDDESREAEISYSYFYYKYINIYFVYYVKETFDYFNME